VPLRNGDWKALEDWSTPLDDWGFPPRMDLLCAMAGALTKIRTEEENNPPRQAWLPNFLDHHPQLSTKFEAQPDR